MPSLRSEEPRKIAGLLAFSGEGVRGSEILADAQGQVAQLEGHQQRIEFHFRSLGQFLGQSLGRCLSRCGITRPEKLPPVSPTSFMTCP